MKNRAQYFPKPLSVHNTVAFRDAEEAWFWFVLSQAMGTEKAYVRAGMTLSPRPCEPVDILKIIDRLYRNRCLLRDHLLVMRDYGRRFLPPDPRRIKEYRDHGLWREAMERLEEPLIKKSIVVPSNVLSFRDRYERGLLLDGEAAE